jgi:predicted lipid-binding transport protein (Tim44 family)
MGTLMGIGVIDMIGGILSFLGLLIIIAVAAMALVMGRRRDARKAARPMRSDARGRARSDAGQFQRVTSGI